MRELPVDAALPRICDALRSQGACVVTASPGSGKTTRVPPAILRSGLAGDGMVIVLEPRRIAARAAATFVAKELGSDVGDLVGYHVRFDRRASARTRLLFVTEGILTRRLQDDPFLDGVGAVVLDEFHERSIHADLALALLEDVRRQTRPELRLVVMSATIDAAPVATYLGGAPVIEASGRSFDVEVIHGGKLDARSIVDGTASAVREALAETRGDMLVFLPGAGEISRVAEKLDGVGRGGDVEILPLHGELSLEQQDRALAPSRRRKVILATNIAETSLTIDGVTVVVDSGFSKTLRVDDRTGIDRLELGRISKASATQRSGRAGRTAPGRAYRLWSEIDHRALDEFETPEIRRIDLARLVLEMRAWGVSDILRFPWFESPDAEEVERAETLLRLLGALDARSGAITAVGRGMLRLPLAPRLARMVIEGAKRGVLEESARMAAVCSERDLILPERGVDRRDAKAKEVGPSDVLLRLDALSAAERSNFRATDLGGHTIDGRAARTVARSAEQIGRLVRDVDVSKSVDEPHETSLLKAVLAGFPDRVARRRAAGSPRALMVGGRGVTLAPTSLVSDDEFFCAVMADAGRRGQLSDSRVSWASRIDPVWLEELFPWAIDRRKSAVFDEVQQRVMGVEQLCYADLVLDEKRRPDVDLEIGARVLEEALRADPTRVLAIDGALESFLLRARSLAAWRPEIAPESLDDAVLVDLLAENCAGRRAFAELRELPLLDLLRARLGWTFVSAVDAEVPERYTLPSGKSVRIRYELGRPPVISARVQDLFGVTKTPALAGGRMPCLVELLSPAYRPVQLTQDLEGFWRGSYALVRKDLRGRYPKHDWPEKPPGV